LTKASSPQRAYLLAAVFGGFLVRLISVMNAPSIEMDGISYATMGRQLAEGRFGEALKNVFPPVYPAFVGLVHLIVPDLEFAGRLVSLIFGTLLIWVCFRFAAKLLNDSGKALWVAFFVAFHPYLIRYSGQVLSESVAVFLFSMTVFSFYTGWQEHRRAAIAVCGICLTLTYLTRPEYLVFYAPFLFILLARRRVADCLVLLVPFLVLGLLYVYYLHVQTGLWIVSRKATLSPFVSLGTFFVNLPLVAYEFFIAVFPPFFLFAVFGFPRGERAFRNLALLLIAFHILSLSFISHSTRRYSVEFVPLCMIFAAQGISALDGYAARWLRKGAVAYAVAAMIVLGGAIQSLSPPHNDRALQKEAGLFLLTHDPGSTVAARLPLVAFYEKGTDVDLLSEMSGHKDMAWFTSIMAERRVKYLIVDEEAEEELPFLRLYLANKVPIWDSSRKEIFVRIYGLS
jgi:hypothetical protein